jgi:hypothetical protein
MIKAYAVLLATVMAGVGSMAARPATVPQQPQQPSFDVNVVSLAQTGAPLKVVPLRVVSDAGPAGLAYRVVSKSEKPLSLYQIDVNVFGASGKGRGRYKITQRILPLTAGNHRTSIGSLAHAQFAPGSTVIVTLGAVQFEDGSWWRSDPVAGVEAAHEYMKTKSAPVIAELRPGEMPAVAFRSQAPGPMDILADVCGYPTGPQFCDAERAACYAMCDPPGDTPPTQCIMSFSCNQKECESDCACKSTPACQ